MLHDNSFTDKELNPNGVEIQLVGTYTTRFVYVDKQKTDEIAGLKLDIQIVDPTLFYPMFSVFVPIKSFDFKAHDIVTFENLRGKFGTAFGKGNTVELQGEADSIKVVKQNK
ncbi:hypothetical protein HRH69_07345 [Enterococcus faecalis]|uniref:hypothetical protein n=1 Tax=Enterococcus faecalis TaxID=1351 RepID=UPI001143FDAF|nr:hypothetical protein [Enterococcus faecalis]NSW13762.1 hypothetical protein [Enterococcus faecalis]TQB25378.1 hypothetical protein FKZ16_09970 [Enterococcus faecalis]